MDEAAQAITAADEALRAAITAIDAIPDPDQAFPRASELYDLLKSTIEHADEVRRRKSAAVYDKHKLDLAETLGQPARRHEQRPE
jgi:hypothetical protein